MDYDHSTTKMNVEGDRLSTLPDDLIHKILSFVDTKQAIETSALSPRWRYIWTSMPSLNFSGDDFDDKFVTNVLTGRDNQIEVSYVKLTCRRKVSREIVKRILDYVFSHNMQQLNITCLEVPISLFRSRSLKHLTLNGCAYEHSLTAPPTWKLPTLTTLNLHCVTLCDENTDKRAGFFSNCANLKNLILKNCRLKGLKNGFNICHAGLSCLTLDGCKGVNVFTPQLKILTISNCPRIHLIDAPNLSSLHYTYDYCYCFNHYSDDDDSGSDDDDDDYHDDDPLQLSTKLFHLEKVDICINDLFGYKAYTRKVVCLLQQLHSVKFLTLNLELVKLLSLYVKLVSHQPSPFVNLKCLKIYPVNVYGPKVTMSSEIKNYLLNGSSGATLTMVSYEEIRAVMNVTSSRNLMRELQVLLDEWKRSSETNTTHIKQDMTTLHEQVKGENLKMKWHFGERMTHIESYWEDLSDQYKKGYKNTRRTISMLREIEGILTKLPTSRRAMLQARFSRLCAEADTIMHNMMGRMKMQCDKMPNR